MVHLQVPDPLTSRRQFLTLIAVAASSTPSIGRSLSCRIRAIAFDAFVLFNPHAILRQAAEVVGERAGALVSTASAKLFGYTWYYTSAGRYAGFNELAADAFGSAALDLGLKLSRADLDRLVAGYSSLELWPDALTALQTLRQHRIRLAILSNLSEPTLLANLRANKIEGLFEFVLSTDETHQYKPSPRAYDLAVRAFQLSRNEIGFAASASWDASGATWFGFPGVWVNRSRLPAEAAHASPLLVSDGMDGVLRLAGITSI